MQAQLAENGSKYVQKKEFTRAREGVVMRASNIFKTPSISSGEGIENGVVNWAAVIIHHKFERIIICETVSQNKDGFALAVWHSVPQNKQTIKFLPPRLYMKDWETWYGFVTTVCTVGVCVKSYWFHVWS